MKKKSESSIWLIAITFITLLSACSKKNDSPAAYPKTVTVTYRVTSATVATASISYRSETMAMTTLTNVALPFSKAITKTVNVNDDVNIGFTLNVPGPIKLEILVDGSVVKTQDFTGGAGALVYLFQ
jgi:hypothetical protein